MKKPSSPIPERLDALLRHLEGCYPREGCGVVFEGPSGHRFRPMANVYDRYAERDPVQFPRSSHTAYRFDGREWLDATEEAEGRGERLTCIVHSHVDAGAYFSAEDRNMAAPEEEGPLLPDVAYLVVAVDAGKATTGRLYAWDGEDFRESRVFGG